MSRKLQCQLLILKGPGINMVLRGFGDVLPEKLTYMQNCTKSEPDTTLVRNFTPGHITSFRVAKIQFS